MPSDLIDRLNLEADRRQKPRDIVYRARETVDRILEKHVTEPLPADVEKDLKQKLMEIAARCGIKSVPAY
jgi:trimethylamine:corrinoid methyltransferase-like protein